MGLRPNAVRKGGGPPAGRAEVWVCECMAVWEGRREEGSVTEWE